MGKSCFWFNVSDHFDVSTSIRLLNGLAATGCWGCIEGLWVLDPAVQAVISNHILAVQSALRTGGTKASYNTIATNIPCVTSMRHKT